ncbi:heparanase-like protein 3 [Humulus lupulus]|uniref:heparanase-like protein 3 n=1 Tax=Humulus lupulus TaxID=3486 RepID=UPI002B40EC10|nr:heparanase-like protein 3 [Humulus lupulus]
MCLVILLAIFLGIYRFITQSSSISGASHQTTTSGTVFINRTAPAGIIDNNDFICATLDWWPPQKCDYGSCSWGTASLLNLDLTNPILLNAIQAFSPLKIRLGGTLQDKVIYESERTQQSCAHFVKNDSELFSFSHGCLPISRWDQLNLFFKQTGDVIIFGLNALSGKIIDSHGLATGAWDSTNAESFIRYTVNKGYQIHGWELGNELSGNGIGARITADQYASDINHLQNIVQNIYGGSKVKPLVLAPGGFFDPNWFKTFINKASKSLQVVTHHIYNLGPGSDEHLIDKILNPSVLSGESKTLSSLQSILKHSTTSAVAWVGESGGAYNSGRNLVTNAFVFSFWYLDQLGMAASYDTKTYCRQTLVGGNYGLLNTNTFVPNPDYYSALLWHRLMGNNVLSTSFSGQAKLRAYAHCSKKRQGITLLLINLENSTTVQVLVSTIASSSNTSNSQQKYQNPRTNFTTTSHIEREEYHLMAANGDLHSQTILLNGKVLMVDSSGVIPTLEPVFKRVSYPITVAPYSVVFVVIPNINVSAC